MHVFGDGEDQAHHRVFAGFNRRRKSRNAERLTCHRTNGRQPYGPQRWLIFFPQQTKILSPWTNW